MNRLFVIAAPSGAGKTSLIHELRRRDSNLRMCVSHTTRPRRATEVDGDDYHFMENESYEQFHLTRKELNDAVFYLKDGMELDRTTYQGETIGVELPINVDLKVASTEPGFAGDTATGARKPATTETGLVVQVPLFVTEGDTIRVDTRTGEYQTRV